MENYEIWSAVYAWFRLTKKLINKKEDLDKLDAKIIHVKTHFFQCKNKITQLIGSGKIQKGLLIVKAYGTV